MEIDKSMNGGNETSTKIKAINPQIVCRFIDGKPCYSIQYYDISDNTFHDGYSSYRLDIVVGWLNECFEEVAGTTEIQKLYNQMMENEKDYQRALEEKNFIIDSLNKVISLNVERVQKCIDRIKKLDKWYDISLDIIDRHSVIKIIKEEMGVEE